MKIAFHLAIKNLLKAGLRTWLNTIVLAFTFVLIIFYNGFINGWYNQAEEEAIAWELGQGIFQNEKFDPQNPFSFQDGHGVIPPNPQQHFIPVLVRQATLYPDGRTMPVVVKGIETSNNPLKLPTKYLSQSNAEIPAIIGKRFASSANLRKGDQVLLRWRDKNGTFDAAEITVEGVFNTNVTSVDNGQIWLPIDKLQSMTGLSNEASYLITQSGFQPIESKRWVFKNLDDLLSDLKAAVAMERGGSIIIYLVLLGIALLAVFDTQVLSIFRRQKEIGTYISLGMTRKQVAGIFTVEGSMYSLFAMIGGGLLGLPLFIYTAKKGIGLFDGVDEIGIAIASRIFPVFSIYLIVGTIILLLTTTTLVSYLPARKIAKMNPVDALKGKML
jgi:ABC-type lipoprotein release transport system permease subunit